VSSRQEGPFIRTAIEQEEDRATATVLLHAGHQGWMELPHGGVLMSMVLELAHRGLDEPVFVEKNYPIRLSFRWGGPSLSLNQYAVVGVEREGGEIRGWVKKDADSSPTLTAIIRSGGHGNGPLSSDPNQASPAMERVAGESRENALPLPYTRNCFVCGSERTEFGLQRRFFCLEDEEPKIVFTCMDPDANEGNNPASFRLDEAQAHPGCLAAILDETMGWSGFVHARQGGVTVKLEIDILRPATPEEKLLCYAACTGTRGKRSSRLFWYAEGAFLPMAQAGALPVMLAQGQWLTVPRLTEEMKRHLIPPEWTARWFPSKTP